MTARWASYASDEFLPTFATELSIPGIFCTTLRTSNSIICCLGRLIRCNVYILSHGRKQTACILHKSQTHSDSSASISHTACTVVTRERIQNIKRPSLAIEIVPQRQFFFVLTKFGVFFLWRRDGFNIEIYNFNTKAFEFFSNFYPACLREFLQIRGNLKERNVLPHHEA